MLICPYSLGYDSYTWKSVNSAAYMLIVDYFLLQITGTSIVKWNAVLQTVEFRVSCTTSTT